MSLYVARNGQSEGPLTEAEVESRLRSGVLAPTDLAWREGMADWTALGRLLPRLAAPPPGPAPSVAASPISLPKPPAGQVPAGIPKIQPRPAGVSFAAHASPEAISIPAPVPAPAPVLHPAPAVAPELAPAPAAPVPSVLDVLRGELRREQEKVIRLEREVTALREELRQVKERQAAVPSPDPGRLAALEERMRRAAALLSGNEPPAS